MALFILNFVLTFKTVPEFLRPIFGQPFGYELNILSAKLLHIFSSLPRLVVKCQMPYSWRKGGCQMAVVWPGVGGGVDVDVTNWSFSLEFVMFTWKHTFEVLWACIAITRGYLWWPSIPIVNLDQNWSKTQKHMSVNWFQKQLQSKLKSKQEEY